MPPFCQFTELSPTPKPKSPTKFPSPSRPFLRRQESHSVVPSKRGGEGRCPLRFLLSQEWSVGECRRFANSQNCRQPQSQNRPQNSRPQVDHSCVGRNLTVSCPPNAAGRALLFEIPAYAGILIAVFLQKQIYIGDRFRGDGVGYGIFMIVHRPTAVL